MRFYIMNITVVGAGNMGLALVSYIAAHKTHSVTLFTTKQYNRLVMHDVEGNEVIETSNYIVSSDPSAFSQADYILCTYPAFLRKDMIDRYGSYIQSGTRLGFVPGYGGAEYSCSELIKNGVIIFGLQRVPYVARATGNKAGILSKKKNIFISAIPSQYTKEVANDIESFLDIHAVELKEYLAITLAPSNPLLHVSGLYGAFHNYDPEKGYTGSKNFYEQWDDDTSRLLFEYDRELQNICKELKPLDMCEVVPLPVYYEAGTPEDMTKKLKSIESFKVVQVPLNGSKPDLSSRMFVEDYPYGVCVIKNIAMIVGVETPIIDKLLDFYTSLSGHKYFNNDGSFTNEIDDTGVPGIYGIKTRDDLIHFYHGGN